jgi:thymidylate kinase
VILEFTGISGAGKSTSEPYLISGLQQRGFGVVVKGELKKKYYKKIICPDFEASDGFIFNQLNRLVRWKTLKSVGLSRLFMSSLLSKLLRNLYFWLSEDIIISTYYSKKYETSPAGQSFYISQEGFVHHCACLKLWHGDRFSGLPKKIVQRFSPEKITIIYFKIPVEQALERLMKRELPYDWPKKINSRSKAKEVLSRFSEAIEDVVDKFQAEGVQVFLVDSSLELEQVKLRVEDIMDHLAQNEKNGFLKQNTIK